MPRRSHRYFHQYWGFKNFFRANQNRKMRLAKIESTEGSTYRKKGSIKLVCKSGEHIGMLSGGCLEQEILRLSLDTKPGETFEVDTRSEEDRFFGSGTGCQGLLKIRVDEINPDLSWKKFRESFLPDCKVPFVIVVGAGADVFPLAGVLESLQWGWRAFDYRQAHVENFRTYPGRCDKAALGEVLAALHIALPKDPEDEDALFPACILMSHSYEYDLQGLIYAAQSYAQYTGLLGPKRRRDKLIAEAKQQWSI